MYPSSSPQPPAPQPDPHTGPQPGSTPPPTPYAQGGDYSPYGPSQPPVASTAAPQSYTPQPQQHAYSQPPQSSQPHSQPPVGYTPPQPHQPANWYTPEPSPQDYAPASVDAYLQQARGASQPQAHAGGGYSPGDQYSMEYLDHMAGTAGGPKIERKFIIAGAAVGVMLLAAAAIFIFTPKKTPTTQTPSRLYGTIVDTQKVTKDAGKRIKNNRLKSINSTLNASLVNASTNLEKPLGGLGVDTKKLRATVQKTEYHDQHLVDKLEDARLNAVYDRTYTTQMEYKVKDIQLNMQAISKAGTTKEANDAFKKVDTDLNTVIKSLEEYRKSGAH